MFSYAAHQEYIVHGKKSKFRRQLNILCWKSYLQRQRRWRILVAETLFALILFILALWSCSPVFLTLLQPEPAKPRSVEQIRAAMPANTIIGYAPEEEHYKKVMDRAAQILSTKTIHAASRERLHDLLYEALNGTLTNSPVIWVIWEPMNGNVWRFNIHSNERAKYLTNDSEKERPLLNNPHLLSGFLAVQVAVSQAIVELSSAIEIKYKFLFAAMPVSPLMKEQNVRDAVSLLLACFTLALLPPVMETEALVVKETSTGFKRALRIYEVDYCTMYLAWLFFTGITITPICILAAITLILIFRWIHIFVAMLVIMAYTYVMMMMSLIMAMFHKRVTIAWVWTALFTITQTMLAELLINHRYDQKSDVLTAILNTLIPPMGLIDGLNKFAMLQTGEGNQYGLTATTIAKMLVTWGAMMVIYFLILMLFQRVHEDAIGGRVHWKSIIFKKKHDKNKLHYVTQPNKVDGIEQEVDEFVPKAISFKNVTKSILNDVLLKNVWMDIYRNEFSLVFTQRYQAKTIHVTEDLILGLTAPDRGTITILGNDMANDYKPMTKLYGMGYCHQPDFLIDELTVQETLTLLIELCLWREASRFIWEYTYLRSKYLLKECQLQVVRYVKVRDLGTYYKTLLCWAIALLLEPRIIIVSQVLNNPASVAVITDKIMQYKKYLAIVHFSETYIKLEYSDRVFLFNHKVLIFGGTPAYMFYKYGQDYRIRLSFAHGCEETKKLRVITRVYEVGAIIRCYYGSLLILKMPTRPAENVANFIQDLEYNRDIYGIQSINVAVPDPDEIYKRAIHESTGTDRTVENIDLSKVEEQAEKLPRWRRKKSCFRQMQLSGLKFMTFYLTSKHVLFVTAASAIITGICFGLNMSKPLVALDKELQSKTILGRELLTVESLSMPTNLIMRIANQTECLAIANAYVLSTTNANITDVKKLSYTCISSKKSLSEYLITRVIDSPQVYVHKYAYGINVRRYKNSDMLRIKALYSPFHRDRAAGARAVARAYMALLRYYSGRMDANIEVVDYPFGLDYTEWVAYNTPPPLLVHLLLVFTIAHVILIPSKENGFIKYNQMHAAGFSPLKYWSFLLMYDTLLYCVLVVLMTAAMVTVFLIYVPSAYADVVQLLMIPLLLLLYGMTCIPQAYLFTLFGQRSSLNSMIYVIMNIVFGEATIVFKYFYGGISQINFMVLSPQYNMAYALLKIKLIFFSNNECKIMHANNMCPLSSFHKCCSRCGVIQPCHTWQSYFTIEKGVVKEIVTIVFGAIFFFFLLMFVEHKMFRILLFYVRNKLRNRLKKKTFDAPTDVNKLGPKEEEERVNQKLAHLHDYGNPFGEYLLADHITYKSHGVYKLRNVCLGLSSGDALALTGRVHHGRMALCNILSGYKRPSRGNVVSISKWKLMTHHHQFCQQVTFCNFRSPLPPWMTVYSALRMLAILRGVPKSHVKNELNALFNLMDMQGDKRTLVANLNKRVRARLHVIAAVLGAPKVVVLDEAMAFQRFYVQRGAINLLNELRTRGHALVISSVDVESQLPVTNRMAILLDGYIYDIGTMNMLIERYAMKGYTVVVHVRMEVDVVELFKTYFAHFVINDVSGGLINCQVLDIELNIAMVFERMERLCEENWEVLSYIVSMVPLANLYNKIIKNEVGYMPINKEGYKKYKTKLGLIRPKMIPSRRELKRLRKLEPKFFITSLRDLPWSVLFSR